jgi:putative ABC transport system permease protein
MTARLKPEFSDMNRSSRVMRAARRKRCDSAESSNGSMDTLLQDLRYSVRNLLRQPTFALTAILTLALGVGASTAMFGVVNAVLLRPLPFPEPDRIVAVTNFWLKSGTRGQNVSWQDFGDWKEQSQSFAALGRYSGWETSVTIQGAGSYATVYNVTPGFFAALGMTASVGRLMTAEEVSRTGSLVAVITDAFWRQRFNGDPAAVGSTVKFSERFYTIVGVLAPGQRYPIRADIYTPEVTAPTSSRSGHNYRVVGRLKDGVTVAQAHSEMTGIAKSLAAAYPSTNEGKSAAVVPLKDLLVGESGRTLYLLFAAVGVVMLIACANVANLLLARSTGREREMVVRAAVGAARARLFRQLLTENIVLALAAAACGIWFAYLGVLALGAVAPSDLPRLDETRVDVTVLMFALAVALATSVLFGLAPAMQVSRVQLVEGLRQGGKGTGIGSRGTWARGAFVIAEIALAVVLVFGAGLLARSLAAMAAVELGFTPERVLVLNTAVPVRDRTDAPRATTFYQDLLSEVRTLPGVTAAGATTALPTVTRSNGGYTIEGRTTDDQFGMRRPQALFIVSTPDYLRTLKIPLKAGRDFNDGDTNDAPLVAIVNEALVRRSFPNEDPIGHRIRCGLDRPEFMTIVGVVADVRTEGPARQAQPELYMPFQQHPGPATALNIVVRTDAANPLTLADTISRTIRQRNADVPVKATTMIGTLETASATPRFRTMLLSAFAVVALLLALAGVYGVMAYSVSQRLPELGVRVALGATPRSIMSLVLTQGARLAAAGLVLGLCLSMLAGRFLEGLLFNVTPGDPVMLALVSISVTVAMLAACYVPGRRAVRVDPMIALRAE